MSEAEVVLAEARDRLEWIRDDYGEDDVDFVTFGPVVELAEQLLERVRERAE